MLSSTLNTLTLQNIRTRRLYKVFAELGNLPDIPKLACYLSRVNQQLVLIEILIWGVEGVCEYAQEA